MPDFWTHTFAIRDVARSIRTITKYPRIAMDKFAELGTHGPDLFFYVNKMRPNRPSMERIGNILHEQKIRNTIRYVFKTAKTAPARTVAYLFGFIAHYIIDSNCHGYVYERTKTSDEHKYLELNLDSFMIHRVYNLTIDKIAKDIVRVGKDDFRNYIMPFYDGLLKENFGITIPERDYIHAGEDIGIIQKIATSKIGRKLPIKPLSKIFKYNVELMRLPLNPDPNIDYDLFLNLYNNALEICKSACLEFLDSHKDAADDFIEDYIDRYILRDFNGYYLDLSVDI